MGIRIWKQEKYIFFSPQNLRISFKGSECMITDRTIAVRSLAEAMNFSSSLFVQTTPKANPTSYPMGTRDPFLGNKARPGREADHSPHLVLR
jgi:hypothetical protein